MFLTKIYTTKTITHAFLLILIFLAGFYVELSQSNEEPENKSQKYADYNYETPNEMVSGQMYELATETKNPLRLALKELEPNINDMNNTITSFGNIMIKIMDVMRWDKVYLKYIKPFLPEKLDLTMISMLAMFYLLTCIPLMLIAERVGLKGISWMAFIPVLQILLFFKMADKSLFCLVFLLVPGIGIAYFVYLWANICGILQKNRILSFLMLVPGVNIMVMWYLALL